MKVHIDIALGISSGSAWGNVAGTIDVASEPQIGDTISFQFPSANSPRPPEFLGQLKVEARVIAANSQSTALHLSLEEVVVSNGDVARQIATFLRESFNLHVDEYE